MTLVSFLLLLLIAGICGAIGQAIAGFQEVRSPAFRRNRLTSQN
jgi:hypothetical protein